MTNFRRSLEIPLINSKVELTVNWIERCVLTVANTAIFKITDAKLYVPVVTLSTEDNVKLSTLLNEEFNRSIYWRKYKVTDNIVVEIDAPNAEKHIRELLDSSYKGVKTLFVLAYDNNQVSVHSFKKYFLPRVRIEKYNIEIDGRNFYDQPINHSIKQYDLVKKVITGQREDYTTDCLLGFAYFEKKLQINCS